MNIKLPDARWRERWILGLTLVTMTAAILTARSLVGGNRDRPMTSGVAVVLPAAELQRLDLTADEIPPGYTQLRSPAALKRLGIKRNPDYTTKPGDMEAIARHGGVCSFISAFGTDESARIILNGVYFRDPKHFDSFVTFQKSQQRPVRAFGMTDAQGQWLLMAGIDPELPYAPDELAALDKGLARYQQRLALQPTFDQLTASQGVPREPPKGP